MKAERACHQSNILKNRLHLFGGSRNGETSATIESISINHGSPSECFDFTPMLEERCFFGMCSVGECFIVAGGGCDNSVLKSCEIFTPQAGKWLKIADMNTKRFCFTLTYFQQKVWAIGGCDKKFNGKSFDTIETYNFADDKWSIIDVKLLVNRKGHSAIAYNDSLFVIGGQNKNEGPLSSVEVYSHVTKQFSFVSAMKIPRSLFGCCLLDSNIYATGGMSSIKDSRRSFTDEVEIYDIKSDVWMKGPKLPLAIAAHSCNSNITV